MTHDSDLNGNDHLSLSVSISVYRRSLLNWAGHITGKHKNVWILLMVMMILWRHLWWSFTIQWIGSPHNQWKSSRPKVVETWLTAGRTSKTSCACKAGINLQGIDQNSSDMKKVGSESEECECWKLDWTWSFVAHFFALEHEIMNAAERKFNLICHVCFPCMIMNWKIICYELWCYDSILWSMIWSI